MDVRFTETYLEAVLGTLSLTFVRPTSLLGIVGHHGKLGGKVRGNVVGNVVGGNVGRWNVVENVGGGNVGVLHNVCVSTSAAFHRILNILIVTIKVGT